MTKDWLVKASAPQGWKSTWDFPCAGAWPPGWPMKYPKPVIPAYDVILDAHMRCGRLNVVCVDMFGEESDGLVGYVLQVQAYDDGNIIRMKHKANQSGQWYQGGLFDVRDVGNEGVVFGMSESLVFDMDRAKSDLLTIKVSLYGMEDGPEVALTVDGTGLRCA